MNLEPYIEEWVLQIRAGEAATVDENMTFNDRLLFGFDAVREIVGKVWLYVILGIGVGALIHGYIPDGYLAGIMGDSSWWSVPASVLIGVPMYTNAAGVIPVIDALLGKGAALGTAPGIHDECHRPVFSRNGNFTQGAETAAHCHIHSSCGFRHPAGRISFQWFGTGGMK